MPTRFLLTLLFALSISILTPASVNPHGGRLDTYGCHHDRKQGGYHCHRGEFAGQSFASQAEMLAARQPRDPAVPPTLPSVQFSSKVVGVTDGDTITVLHNGRDERVRLYGIDCPEKG